jgi:hypothetical protein
MLEPRLVLEYPRSLQGSRTAQRYLRCCDQLQQGLGIQAELSSTGNRRNHRNTPIRPLNRHPDEPTPWMFYINVLLPILAPDGAHHR